MFLELYHSVRGQKILTNADTVEQLRLVCSKNQYMQKLRCGRHDVQEFGIVIWTWNFWHFVFDWQVMKYTSRWGWYKRYRLTHKTCVRKFFHIKIQDFLEGFSSWDWMEAEINFFVWFKAIFPGVRIFCRDKESLIMLNFLHVTYTRVFQHWKLFSVIFWKGS